jgi:hypothetical protein
MFVAEIVIETLLLLKAMPPVPFRFDFFSLTIISSMLAIQSVVGIRESDLDVSMNALVVGLSVEGFLVLGDIVFLVEFYQTNSTTIYVRTPFLVLTSINVILTIYLMLHLHGPQLPSWYPTIPPTASKTGSQPPENSLHQVVDVLTHSPAKTLDKIQHDVALHHMMEHTASTPRRRMAWQDPPT